MRNSRLIIVLVLLAGLIAACGTSSAVQPSASPHPSRAAATARPTATPLPSFPAFDHGQIPDEIVGMYTFTVFGKDSAVELLADGTYVMYGALAFGQRPRILRGEYGVFDDTMRFGNEVAESSMARACIGDGTYKWSFDGETLSMTLIEDACALDINRQAEWQSGWDRVD